MPITDTIVDEWVDSSMYPFQTYSIQLSSGKMNYIDEGDGEVLLFIHGAPTWSFLYRDFIKHFSKSYRCIAIDHIGFGLSEKPVNFPGTPQAHSRNLTEFIEKMYLSDITMVVHDIGGPIGISAAIRHSVKINRLVLFNSWLWETESNPEVESHDKILHGWVGKQMYLKSNISPRKLLKRAFYDKEKLTTRIHQHYISPFPDYNSRISLLNSAKSIKGSSDWFQLQKLFVSKIMDKPWLIIWGNKDEVLNLEYLSKWRKMIPGATIHELESGHYVQEEKASESISIMEAFLSESNKKLSFCEVCN